MAGLRSLLQQTNEQASSKTNFEVDYVIHYKIPSDPTQKAEAEAAFVQLIEALAGAGFATEVRPGDATSLLVFARIASEDLLNRQVYRYRVQDWLYGVRTSAPNQDLAKFFEDEPVTEAERLRLAYLLITKPKNEGGAGISARIGHWKHVAAIFPPHDQGFNRSWIKEWSTKYFLDDHDLDRIRDKFGEQVAFYFAFLQSYFAFLLFPAAFGFGAWLVLGPYSWFYGLVNCLWSVVFFEHWHRKEVDYAVRWGVRGVSKIQRRRPQFRFDREAQDPVTGEVVKVFSPLKRLSRQLLQVPFALVCALTLGGLIGGCFAIEIFITEIYNGPFTQYLTFLPTVLLSIFMPTLTMLFTQLAEKLTCYENYETQDEHQASYVQKIFVLNFITSYLPVFLTAFIYVPFGKILVPYLDVFQLTAQRFTAEGQPLPTKEWKINPDRLTKQVIYFTVTAQIVNFATEVIVPYAKRKVFQAVKEVQSEMAAKHGECRPEDAPQEADFLCRMRNEAELDEYDVTIDYREMIVQFGYLSLISVVWPLTACSFLVNNWVEARSDAVKIAIGSQRPIPWRADSIGPWLNSLGFLSWFGSITSTVLLYLFSSQEDAPDGSPGSIRPWALLLCILFAEHMYLLVKNTIHYAMRMMDSPGLQKERAERFSMRKLFLEQTFGPDFAEETPSMIKEHAGGEKLTREALEEEARVASTQGQGSATQQFWQRQRGALETIQVGRSLFAESVSKQNKTTNTAKA